MKYVIVIDPMADADMEEAGDWYETQQPGLQQEFLAELQSTIRLVSLNPYAFHPLKARAQVRRALANRFPYRVFFTVESDEVYIFRVLHTARHDREWKRFVPRR